MTNIDEKSGGEEENNVVKGRITTWFTGAQQFLTIAFDCW